MGGWLDIFILSKGTTDSQPIPKHIMFIDMCDLSTAFIINPLI